MASEITPSVTENTNPDLRAELNASVIQIAMLNNKLPCGYRFELYETVRKNEPSEFKTGKRKKMVFLYRQFFKTNSLPKEAK